MSSCLFKKKLLCFTSCTTPCFVTLQSKAASRCLAQSGFWFSAYLSTTLAFTPRSLNDLLNDIWEVRTLSLVLETDCFYWDFSQFSILPTGKYWDITSHYGTAISFQTNYSQNYSNNWWYVIWTVESVVQ